MDPDFVSDNIRKEVSWYAQFSVPFCIPVKQFESVIWTKTPKCTKQNPTEHGQ